jgi:hypothetical protein
LKKINDSDNSASNNGDSFKEPPDDNNDRVKCETLEDGTEAFMKWMNSTDKKSLSSANPIVLIKFINDKHTIVYDTIMSQEVDVELTDGIPFCNFCKSDDCAHVGFAICIEQLYGHRRGEEEQTVDKMIDY